MVVTLTPYLKEELTRIREEQGPEGFRPLWTRAREEGINVTQKVVKEFLAGLSSEERVEDLFTSVPLNGKGFARGLNTDWQVDTIVYPDADADQGIKRVLFVMDAFSRKVYAEPLTDGTSETAAAAMAKILLGNPTPEKISTDGGPEFMATFDRLLERKKIDHATKDKLDHYPTMESGIGRIKLKLAKAKEHRGRDFLEALPMVVKQYNKNPLGTTGVAPGQVASNPMAQFFIQKEMAANIKHNVENEIKMEADLDAAGGYTAAMYYGGGARMKRGHKKKREPPTAVVQGPDRFAFGLHDEEGNSIPTKFAKPSNVTFEDVPDAERNPLRNSFRYAADLLRAELGKGPMPLVDVAAFLKNVPGFTEKFKIFNKGLQNMLKLFPELFRVQNGVVLLPTQTYRLVRTRHLAKPITEVAWNPDMPHEEDPELDLGPLPVGPPGRFASALRPGGVMIDLDDEPAVARPPPLVPRKSIKQIRTEPQEFTRDVAKAGPLTRLDAPTEPAATFRASASSVASEPQDIADDVHTSTKWMELARDFADQKDILLRLNTTDHQALAQKLQERWGSNIEVARARYNQHMKIFDRHWKRHRDAGVSPDEATRLAIQDTDDEEKDGRKLLVLGPSLGVPPVPAKAVAKAVAKVAPVPAKAGGVLAILPVPAKAPAPVPPPVALDDASMPAPKVKVFGAEATKPFLKELKVTVSENKAREDRASVASILTPQDVQVLTNVFQQRGNVDHALTLIARDPTGRDMLTRLASEGHWTKDLLKALPGIHPQFTVNGDNVTVTIQDWTPRVPTQAEYGKIMSNKAVRQTLDRQILKNNASHDESMANLRILITTADLNFIANEMTRKGSRNLGPRSTIPELYSALQLSKTPSGRGLLIRLAYNGIEGQEALRMLPELDPRFQLNGLYGISVVQ